MKVLLLNGSPKAQGCTYTALCEIEKELHASGIETEIYQVGSKPILGCTGCESCHKLKTGLCIHGDDTVNAFIEKAKTAAGFIFGSPVHYASASGAVCSLLDRAFYANSTAFAYKPGASIASCRRGGATATFDQLNKYFTICNMPVVSSQYWNMVHGNTPQEVVKDLEGMQIMRTLGKNMAWLLKCIESGRQNGITLPEKEKRVSTNFIR